MIYRVRQQEVVEAANGNKVADVWQVVLSLAATGRVAKAIWRMAPATANPSVIDIEARMAVDPTDGGCSANISKTFQGADANLAGPLQSVMLHMRRGLREICKQRLAKNDLENMDETVGTFAGNVCV